MMKLTDFEELLLLHGSNPDQWPKEFSSKAAGLLAHSRSARELLESFEGFEDVLRNATKVSPEGATLTGRILTRISERENGITSNSNAMGRGVVTVFGSALALTMLGLGFFVGSLDLVWLDGANPGDLTLLLFGETQELMDTL